MSAPILTSEQITALTDTKAVADAGVLGAIESAAAWNTVLIQQQKVDDAFKAFFDFFDGDIIVQYETERRFLDGQAIASPIVEQDILNFVNEITTSRLWNDTKIPERIAEFDGGPLVATDDEHENFLLPAQDNITSDLQTFTGQISLDAAAVTSTSLTASSTTLDISTPVTETVSPDDLIFIGNGSDAAIVKVITATQGGTCSGETNPPQVTESACIADGGAWTPGDLELTIQVIIPPIGTIASGAGAGQLSYTGFNNTERTNKTANNSNFQPIMDTLLNQIKDIFDRRIVVLNNQITALQANDDSGLDLTAETKAQTSKTAVNGFLGGTPPSTIDISDTGLTSIDTESTSRQTEVTARISAIITAISVGNFFNLRFDNASNRARLDNGSLRLLNEYTNAKDGANASSVTAQDLSDRYDSLLNP